MNFQIPTKMCKCGTIHPPPWDDNCPIIKASQIEDEEKGNHISKFVAELSIFLYSSSNYEEIIKKISEIVSKVDKL